ncbi:MAG: DeoR/GlpR family DNA-binding transcription regulator [Lachnospiraceae bacterium]
MRIHRIDEIEKYIIEQHSASLDQLCEIFQISKATLRRDLEELMPRGTIEKVYGGVIAVTPKEPRDELLSYSERNIKHAEAKAEIAQLAASFIQDNDTIYIDTGTSTLGIMDHLSGISNLTIITNSVLVASKALANGHIKTIMLPGVINVRSASTVGNGCQEYLKRCHIQKAFMACTGITEHGAANAAPEEYEIKKVALEQSRFHYLLVDHSKFDKSALMVYSSLDNIHHVLTDRQPPEKYQNLFSAHQIQVSTPETPLASVDNTAK